MKILWKRKADMRVKITDPSINQCMSKSLKNMPENSRKITGKGGEFMPKRRMHLAFLWTAVVFTLIYTADVTSYGQTGGALSAKKLVSYWKWDTDAIVIASDASGKNRAVDDKAPLTSLMDLNTSEIDQSFSQPRAGTSDLYDTAILYSAVQLQNSDINFCKISEYYGLRCKKIDLLDVKVTDGQLRDANNGYLKAIGINARTLENELDAIELQVLKNVVSSGGSNLLVYETLSDASEARYENVRVLTDDKILGTSKLVDSEKDWVISVHYPRITREFTGLKLSYLEPQGDLAIRMDPEAADVNAIISATDDSSALYPVFVRYKLGKGNVFLLGSQQMINLNEVGIRELYQTRHFSEIVPLMMFLRYAGGREAWHRDIDYANLTIDDPPLKEPYGNLSFKKLLTEMEDHNFHSTIAFIPWNYDRSEPEVVKLFLNYPERYSLVIHGNNHDHYEFHKYKKVPIHEQEKDIIEALNRMEEHRTLTGIHFGNVMIFPHGISPAGTLELLKKYNFRATVNNEIIPLGASVSKDQCSRIELAQMNYGGIAAIKRHPVQGYEIWSFDSAPANVRVAPYAFDLFLDKPVLLGTHQDYFASGMDAFNPSADGINELVGEVEWKSLGHIIEHLYLEKENDDGSVDVLMYGNKLILSNRSDSQRLYHIRRQESLNIPIEKVTINGVEANYNVENHVFEIDRGILPGDSIEIEISYSQNIPTIAKFPSGFLSDLQKSGVRIFLLRYLPELRCRYSANSLGRKLISLYYQKRLIFMGIVGIIGITLIGILAILIIRLNHLKKLKNRGIR